MKKRMYEPKFKLGEAAWTLRPRTWNASRRPMVVLNGLRHVISVVVGDAYWRPNGDDSFHMYDVTGSGSSVRDEDELFKTEEEAQAEASRLNAPVVLKTLEECR